MIEHPRRKDACDSGVVHRAGYLVCKFENKYACVLFLRLLLIGVYLLAKVKHALFALELNCMPHMMRFRKEKARCGEHSCDDLCSSMIGCTFTMAASIAARELNKNKNCRS